MSSGNVEYLVSMGFPESSARFVIEFVSLDKPRNDCRAALQACDNDIQTAVDRLVNGLDASLESKTLSPEIVLM